MAGAAPEPNWTTTGGLGWLALIFSALALLRLTFLGMSSEEGDLPRGLLGAPVVGLDSGSYYDIFLTPFYGNIAPMNHPAIKVNLPLSKPQILSSSPCRSYFCIWNKSSIGRKLP